MKILVDDDDYAALCAHKWAILRDQNTCYARTKIRKPSNKSGFGSISMHRLLLAVHEGASVHHIDGNGLNNQRSNLIICSHSDNMRARSRTWGSSRFKGVTRRGKKWLAQIKFNGKCSRLGVFLEEEDAAKAYDSAARLAYGKFAVTNFGGIQNIEAQPGD